MKTLVTLSVLLVGSASFACPDFSGKYACSSKNGMNVLVEYKKTGDQYLLEDGVVKASDEGVDQVSQGMGFEITTTGICRGDDVLEVQSVTRNDSTKKYLGKVVRTYHPLQNGNLDIWMKSDDGKTSTDTFIECKRQY